MKKFLAVMAVLCAMCCVFAACQKEDAEPTATPAVTPTGAPQTTPIPETTIEHDETKFCLDGVILVAYIGDEAEVTIPDGVIIISDNAFRDCTTVQTVTIPDTVTEIGKYAFSGCTSLKEISIPRLVRSLGDYCFAGCTSLTKAETKTQTTVVGKGAFKDCTSLETVVLSTALTVVNESLFENCTSITSVALPAVIEVKDRAFYGCTSLTKIDAVGLATIGDSAFENCTAFENGNISSNILSVGTKAFEGTAWLNNAKAAAKSASGNDRYVTIGKGVLIYMPLVLDESEGAAPGTLALGSAVRILAPGSLDECAGDVMCVVLSSTVTEIGKGVFSGFAKLTYVELPNSITAVPANAFENCANLETVLLLGKVTSIGDYAFSGCTKLSAVAIKKIDKKTDSTAAPTETPADATPAPETNNAGYVKELNLSNGIVSVGAHAFDGCVALKEIKASDDLLTIGDYAFDGCTAVETAQFGKGVSNVGVHSFRGLPWFENWNGGEEGNFLIIGDGVLIKAVGFDFVQFGEDVKYLSATLDGLREIASKMFYDNKLLTSVVIPDTVTKIADYAFYYAVNLQSVVIPDSVTEIGERAFYGCEKLERIVLPAGLTSIADYAFYGCASLCEVVIPETVVSIGKYAFYNCIALDSVEIPETVTSIGEYAFTNTAWYNGNVDKFFVVGDGLLLKYRAYEKETSFTSADPAIKAIVGGAFNATFMLEKITLPETVTSIGAYAFSGCTTVKEIISSAVSAGERAFNNCVQLENVVYGTENPQISEDAYFGCTVMEK